MQAGRIHTSKEVKTMARATSATGTAPSLEPEDVRATLLRHVDANTRDFLDREGLRISIKFQEQELYPGGPNQYLAVDSGLWDGRKKAAEVFVNLYHQPVTLKYHGVVTPFTAYVDLVTTGEAYRGRGYAGILLKLWTGYFDDELVSSYLIAYPMPQYHATIKFDALVRFYQHAGYELGQQPDPADVSSIMMRVPSKRRVAALTLTRWVALAAKAGL